jgi:predicted site-specific integrase-resolvase
VAANKEPFIGTATAAELLGWTQRRVQRAANTGQIPVVATVEPDGRYLFKKAAIEELARREREEREQHET